MKRTVYLAYVCGYANIRDHVTDEILHSFKGKRSYEQHLEQAKKIADGYHWELV